MTFDAPFLPVIESVEKNRYESNDGFSHFSHFSTELVLQDDVSEGSLYFERLPLPEDTNSDDHDHDDDDQHFAETVEPDTNQTVLAQHETKHVFRIRIVFILVLILSAFAVAWAVYYYVSESERQDFEDRFEANAIKIRESIGFTLDQTLGSIDAFAHSMVSLAKATNQTWPFVTIPDFSVRAAKILGLSKGVYVTNSIYVSNEDREQWLNYSSTNNHWINESLVVQEKALNNFYFGAITKDWVPYGHIHNNNGDSPLDRPFYLPNWQSYPVVYNEWPLYNWDLWDFPSFRQGIGEEVMLSHLAGITPAYHLPDPNDPADVLDANISAEWFRDYVPPGRNLLEPASDVYYVRVHRMPVEMLKWVRCISI
jgi:hypothetical protein